MARGGGRGRGRIGNGPGGGGGGRGRGGSVAGFLAPRTPRQAAHQANAAAGAEYNPEIRNVREEAAGARKREADLGSWYRQLAADYQGAQKAGSKALGAVGEITGDQEAEAAARSGAAQSGLAAQDAAFGAVTGAPQNTAGLAKIAQAGAAAEKARVAEAKLPVSEQADFVARLGTDRAAAALSGIEARQQEHGAREKLKTNLAAVRKEKGAARVTKENEYRESDRSYASELAKLRLAKREARTSEQAAAASTALAQAKMAEEARQNRISNRQARTGLRQSQEGINIDRNKARTSAEVGKAEAQHYKTEGGPTRAEKRARGEHQADAMAAAKALLGIAVPKNPKQWAQFEAGLIEKLGSSYAAQASAAVAKLKAEQGYQSRVRKATRAFP